MPAFPVKPGSAAAPGAAAAGLFAGQQPDQDRGGTSDSSMHVDSPGRTVFRTGAAFHAPVHIRDPRDSPRHGKDSVRANFCTTATADAFLCVIFQGGDILQVHLFHVLPFQATRPAIISPTTTSSPSNAAMAMAGMARRISRLTPEGDVYVVLPVKFIAAKAVSDGSSSR